MVRVRDRDSMTERVTTWGIVRVRDSMMKRVLAGRIQKSFNAMMRMLVFPQTTINFKLSMTTAQKMRLQKRNLKVQDRKSVV